MNSKEKAFLKRNLIVILTILALFALVCLISAKVMGNDYKDNLFVWESEQKYNQLEVGQIRIEFDKDDIVQLESLKKEEGRYVYTLSPVNRGEVFMTVYLGDTEEILHETYFRVLPSGTIVEISTGNFTNYRAFHLIMLLFCFTLTLVLWISFAYVQKELKYSYQAIFFSGLAIWMTLISILQIRVWLMKVTMLNVYSVLKMAALNFMLLSSPLMLIFCIALSVSNIQLIRKEGFHPANALGILLSFVMIGGIIGAMLISNSFSGGSDMQLKIFDASTGIYHSIYAFFECFLIGAIICGTVAAKHEPDYDKDYLVILGCQVKPDGSLYPLIRGRVDRAIAFYQKQLEKTGKKAVFVPSGGQGPDEVMSEAAAMKRYLLENGIPEEQILLEDQSANTIENMSFSRKLIEERTPDAKVVFSTTNYHVFRSGIISRQQQFEPDGMGSRTKWYFWPNAFIREVVGMVVYKWKSIVIVLIPIVAFLIAIQFVG